MYWYWDIFLCIFKTNNMTNNNVFSKVCGHNRNVWMKKSVHVKNEHRQCANYRVYDKHDEILFIWWNNEGSCWICSFSLVLFSNAKFVNFFIIDSNWSNSFLICRKNVIYKGGMDNWYLYQLNCKICCNHNTFKHLSKQMRVWSYMWIKCF